MLCLSNGHLSTHMHTVWCECLRRLQQSDRQVYSLRHSRVIKAVQTSGSQSYYTKTILNNSQNCTYPNFQSCPPLPPCFFLLLCLCLSGTRRMSFFLYKSPPSAYVSEWPSCHTAHWGILKMKVCIHITTSVSALFHAQHSAPHCLVLSITIYLLPE